MKKWICMMLLLACLVALSACTQGSNDDKTGDPSDTGSGTTSGTDGLENEEEPEPTYDGIDHVITVPEGKDITILQVTDTQAMLHEGIRTIFTAPNGRKYESLHRYNQVHNAFFASGVTDTHTRYWQYVEEGVERTNPDVIVLTGDNIYGETDDEGKLWLEMIEVLDSFEIPWICIFGNHDNESQMGVNWQIEAVRNSKYGYMKDGDLENGNGNYTVGIRQGDEFKYIFYMLDTNGCSEKPNNYGEGLLRNNPDIGDIQQTAGVYADQLAWMRDCHEKISAYAQNVPSMIFLHIPPKEAYDSVMEDYSDVYGTTWPLYTNRGEDMGLAMEGLGGFDSNGALFEVAKEVGCVGMFMGHQHKVATSTFYDGIRLTYGLKTGTGDYHDRNMLGTTKITISEDNNSFAVEHVFTEIDYPLD